MCLKHIGQHCTEVAVLIRGSYAPLMLSGVAEHKIWVVILMAVQTADCFVSAIIAAGTVIALSARETSVKNGYRQEKKNFCLFLIFMWSLPCLTPLINYASINLKCFTISCLKQHGACLTPLVMTINGWERKQV